MNKFDTCQKGDVLSETTYYTVTEKNQFGVQVNVIQENTKGIEHADPVFLPEDYINNYIKSSAFVNETKFVTPSELAKVLAENTRIAMKLCYKKKNQEKTKSQITSDLEECQRRVREGEPLTDLIHLALPYKEGEMRVIQGYHNGSTTEQGRIMFVENNTTYRQVDPRTLQWIIVNGIKYQLK